MPDESNTIIEAGQNLEIVEIITKGLAYAIIAAGLLSIIFVFVGGISFILSGGQEDKVKQAVSTIRYAIFGLIITVLAVVIVGAVGKILGIDLIRYINISDIFDTIRNIGGNGVSGGGSSLD
ncbi:hypothetical protein A2483_04875 [Candidatus Peregrinibacteria bacterium RIFOXYC2_FULL_33_13]|nr:MAG: hypothetical protein UR27_C0021G0022 [Candidatus Peregrinibacteria bacterium GW2011_GWA2_33_10]KKP40994.1 MAG: hypothetical protein UR30_C0002G0028 [Candidatus Peregrinibacteria bacterium GW2011_GWC2_33_13]OGJ50298.1 MAG: hypothetical protein A2229_03670 [Candidatus Peregrinibacteria bacterium RIFOXYA2_FULL_33_7]OGJ52677.1 MAG: hypothetical protein A2483_04875 [Candidatus Peregrinibacteria bacterium RIFOXYC2_FULL_33_13]